MLLILQIILLKTLEKIKLKNKLMIEHRRPETLSDFIALSITKFLRIFADTFFAKRYGHRAVV